MFQVARSPGCAVRRDHAETTARLSVAVCEDFRSDDSHTNEGRRAPAAAPAWSSRNTRHMAQDCASTGRTLQRRSNRSSRLWDSSKPPGGLDHENYSFRAMANYQIETMRQLGHHRFLLAGHDRGGRVAHRLCLDHPEAVEKVALLDIAPTLRCTTTLTRNLQPSTFGGSCRFNRSRCRNTSSGSTPSTTYVIIFLFRVRPRGL